MSLKARERGPQERSLSLRGDKRERGPPERLLETRGDKRTSGEVLRDKRARTSWEVLGDKRVNNGRSWVFVAWSEVSVPQTNGNSQLGLWHVFTPKCKDLEDCGG